MTFRMPKNFSSQLTVESGASILEAQILAEHAAGLGHHGRLVEKAMAAWKICDRHDTDYDSCLDAAATAVYNYFIQREAIGVNNHDHPIAFYGITGPVLARMGAKRDRL